MKKRRIVIASILKGVDDTRMFEKLAISLSRLYEVHIIGSGEHEATASDADRSIFFHSLGTFTRLSAARFSAPFKIIGIAREIKPEILIITTHELLVAAWLTRMVAGCRVIYDIQENYARNIYYGQTVPAIIKFPLAAFLRIKEWIFSGVINHYFLAEKSYSNELDFTRNKSTILENKLQRVPKPSQYRKSKHEKIQLLFTGTMAETTGVFTAIEIAAKLHAVEQRVQLCIVGYAHQDSVREKIRSAVADKPFVKVIGLDEYVSHHQILEWVDVSDFGIIAYPPNLSTSTAFPTKLFEYMGHQLPILVINNKVWVDYCGQYDGCIPYDPLKLDAADLIEKMKAGKFYSRFPEIVFWESEEARLMQAVGEVMS